MARSGLAYPRPGHPLVPSVLVPYFGDEVVPALLASAVGLPPGVRLRELNGQIWNDLAETAVNSLTAHVISVVQTGRTEQRLRGATERIFEPPVPLDALRIPLRARNALLRHRIARDGVVYPVTLQDLAQKRNVGGGALLQLLAAAEEAHEAAVTQPVPFDVPASYGSSATEVAVQPNARRPSRAVRTEAKKLEKRRWARKVSRDDPRLGAEIASLVPGALTAYAASQLLPALTYEPSEARQKAGAIRRFMARADAMGRLTVEAELDEILGALTKAKHQAALRRRFGWGGGPPATLEVAAQEIGVTRERVRQIESKFKRRLSSAWTPALDRALRIVGRVKFSPATELQEALRSAGLLVGEFPLVSLAHAAELFGRDVPSLAEHDGMIGPADFARTVAGVQLLARRLTDRWGATTVAELASVLADRDVALDEDIIRRTLDGIPDVRFLEEERNWFWMAGSTRNRLLNYVRKIVSVAGSIDIGELRNGVGRHHQMRGFRPPRAVLARLCEDTGDYKVVGLRVVGNEDLPDWHDVLSGNEQILAEALFEHGPVMRRADLEELVVLEGGMNRVSFYNYLTYLPILARYAPGVYGLRGARVTAAEISALIPPVIRTQVLRNNGWSTDRRLWVVYRLSAAATTSGVLSVPAAFSPLLRGQFNLLTEDDAAMGTLVIEEGRLWGISPFYRRRGVEAGDHLLLTFNLQDRTARVEVGDEALALKHQVGE